MPPFSRPLIRKGPVLRLQSGDAESAISARVEDSLPPILEVPQSVDSTFPAVPPQADKAKAVAFVNSATYRDEFLTSSRKPGRTLGQTLVSVNVPASNRSAVHEPTVSAAAVVFGRFLRTGDNNLLLALTHLWARP